MSDPFDLARFVLAQAPLYASVVEELRAGQKRSHWMWFVFPQIAGLGFSPMARRYAIASSDEARAYLGHPELGQRLRESTQLVLELRNRTAHQIFGSPDDLKFRSSMTLFCSVEPETEAFSEALRRYYDGRPDEATLRLLTGPK